ncbi:hypothetical protein AQUCO_01400329v1 [Aquilegia coerulea]|uniref:RING-type domain-containing protein n=1 Tax=Aquilegia coerulea TaxID=218851 RepID=A0A2G5DVT1_AQUCA|nr:hypothetical protein AQUCO_01400329v1 [Aquilegia coerulea]
MEEEEEEEEEMQYPECPVCLQVYNNETTIPRVLSCGHSACQTCLPQLPQRFPNIIRCPSCNQLVHYPNNHGGSSSLPKNIDLLSFISQQQQHQQNPQNPNPQYPNSSEKSVKQLSQGHEFLPKFWSEEFYTIWKDWVLEIDSIEIEMIGVGDGDDHDPHISLLRGRKDGEIVSLLYVGSAVLNDSVFDFSYVVRIMQFLYQLNGSLRDELCLILRSLKLRFRVCKVYGLWMNSENGSVFLVCEMLNSDLKEKLSEWRNRIVCENGNEVIRDGKQRKELNWGMPGFAVVGMELCEALASLHADGLVSGCLALSCFHFDGFGRVFVNSNEVLVLGRRIRKWVREFAASGCQRSEETERIMDDIIKIQPTVNLELLFSLLHKEGVALDFGSSECSVGYFSDVWSLGCILVSFLDGGGLNHEYFYQLIPQIGEKTCDEFLGLYTDWVERVNLLLENLLGPDYVALHQILCRCLEYDPGNRPLVTDVWKCIRDLLVRPQDDILGSLDTGGSLKNMIHCISLGHMCDMPTENDREFQNQNDHNLEGSGVAIGFQQDGDGKNEKNLVEGLRIGKFECVDLMGHADCISGLAVGGGFLFSSSFDKTVNVWSLQDCSHVQSFKGHEHRVMGVVFVDAAEPLCVSGDSGGGIFVWGVGASLQQDPLKSWYEQKDWRYSGIHALAVSGTEHIYTGSGDKSVKAWSLQDYTLVCTMNGHKSVVSSLVVCDGVLYSGSWDGTIRLWSINDHSPLTVLGDDTPGNLTSVLSLSVYHHTLAAAYENGCVKLWRNDMLSRSIETQSGAIFALDIKEEWLFMGGWNKTVDVKVCIIIMLA